VLELNSSTSDAFFLLNASRITPHWHFTNLLPAEPRINLEKRARIPHPALVLKRRDAIIYYWRIYADALKDRFGFQVRKAFGTPLSTNWESTAFVAFYEIICRMATHNVADTYQPRA